MELVRNVHSSTRYKYQKYHQLDIRNEGRYEEVEKILRNNSLGASLKEKYWRAILALVKDFWKAVGTSWNDVLNLSKDFSFDFLWNEETYDFEDASEAIVKIVRQEMGKISVIPKEKAQGGEEFVYDDNYLWIAPGLFTRWIQKSRLDAGTGRKFPDHEALIVPFICRLIPADIFF